LTSASIAQVLTVKSVNDLKLLKVRDVLGADMVLISSRLFASPAYQALLAEKYATPGTWKEETLRKNQPPGETPHPRADQYSTPHSAPRTPVLRYIRFLPVIRLLTGCGFVGSFLEIVR
jgi:hypothetical protein